MDIFRYLIKCPLNVWGHSRFNIQLNKLKNFSCTSFFGYLGPVGEVDALSLVWKKLQTIPERISATNICNTCKRIPGCRNQMVEYHGKRRFQIYKEMSFTFDNVAFTFKQIKSRNCRYPEQTASAKLNPTKTKMNPKKLTQSDLFYEQSVSQIVQRKMNSIISGAHDHIRFRRLTIARVGNEPNMNPKKLDQIRSTSTTFGKEILNQIRSTSDVYKVLQESHNSLPF